MPVDLKIGEFDAFGLQQVPLGRDAARGGISTDFAVTADNAVTWNDGRHGIFANRIGHRTDCRRMARHGGQFGVCARFTARYLC